MLRSQLLFLTILLAALVSKAQSPVTIGVQGIKDAATKFNEQQSEERVYLHTDKDVYFAGDTIWFKAYVLDATHFSDSKKSKLMFIELHDDSADVIRRVSVIIKNGLGNAQIPLITAAFHDGGYTIRAYTTWMRNFDVNTVFSKRIYIGKANKSSWLASTAINLTKVEDKEQLVGQISLKDLDRMPVGLRNVSVRVIANDRVLYDKELKTTLDGKLSFKVGLSENRNGGDLRVEVADLRKDAMKQVLRIPIVVNRPQKIDLQFMPEGGELVAGLSCVVGFKAIAENGLGAEVSGKIVDSKGKQVAQFSSAHNGMGHLRFTPAPAEKYFAKINQPVNVNQVFALPIVKASGTNITVINSLQGDSVKVLISATADIANIKNLLYLVGSARGVVCYAMPFRLKGKSLITIAKRLFPTGIARITLLKEKLALNERVFFVDHQDGLAMSIDNKNSFYKTGDSISMGITVKDKDGQPVVGSFSLALTDDSQVLPDSAGNQSISTALLLSSNLKGNIETPAFYLDRSIAESWTALDDLLLTQGWTGFDWKNVFGPVKIPKYDATILAKDDKGYVNYLEFPVVSQQQITPWFLEQPDRAMIYPKDVVAESEKEGIYYDNLLKEVKITSKKRPRGFNLNGVGFADIVLDSTDVVVSGAKGMYELLRQKLPGLTMEKETIPLTTRRGYLLKYRGKTVYFMWDGSLRTIIMKPTKQELKEDLNRYAPEDFDLIEIMYTDQYINKYFPPVKYKTYAERSKLMAAYASIGQDVPKDVVDGVIVLMTLREKQIPKDNRLSILTPQKFYQPKYNVATRSTYTRASVFWAPNVITDITGRAIVSFHAPNNAGSYSLNIQGADLRGGLLNYRNKIIVK